MKKMYYLLPMRCIAFLLTFVVGATVVGKSVEEISNWWSVVASIVNALTIAVLIFIVKKKNSSYLELINYQKGKTTWKQIVGMSVIIVVVGVVGMYLAGYICYGVIPYAAPMMIAPIPLWLAIFNVVILPISTAFAEDGLYLGCGVNTIRNKYVLLIIFKLRLKAELLQLFSQVEVLKMKM